MLFYLHVYTDDNKKVAQKKKNINNILIYFFFKKEKKINIYTEFHIRIYPKVRP